MSNLFGLTLLILALWLASEICAHDMRQPRPKDPFRLDRWRRGENEKEPDA